MAGELAKAPRPQAVQADIDPLDARAAQLAGHALQLGAIGGQGELVQARQLSQALHQAEHVGAYQWFAAGEADLADAQLRERPGHLV